MAYIFVQLYCIEMHLNDITLIGTRCTSWLLFKWGSGVTCSWELRMELSLPEENAWDKRSRFSQARYRYVTKPRTSNPVVKGSLFSSHATSLRYRSLVHGNGNRQQNGRWMVVMAIPAVYTWSLTCIQNSVLTFMLST